VTHLNPLEELQDSIGEEGVELAKRIAMQTTYTATDIGELISNFRRIERAFEYCLRAGVPVIQLRDALRLIEHEEVNA
jgi:hypothetical protein